VREEDISTTSFAGNLGARSQMFSLFPTGRLPNVTFVPQTDKGFVLLLQPPAGERFQLPAGSYRLVLALTMAEVGASVSRLVSTVANGYVQVELTNLNSSLPLDADWFASDATTGLGQDANGKWVARLRGSTKSLTRAMSFAAIRISLVYARGAQFDNSVTRRSIQQPITVVASPSASVLVTYALG
jgi:hypothetical protein